MYKGEPQPQPSVCPLALSTEPKSQVQRFQFLPDLLGKVRPFRAGSQGGWPAWSQQSFTAGQCFRPAWRLLAAADRWMDGHGDSVPALFPFLPFALCRGLTQQVPAGPGGRSSSQHPWALCTHVPLLHQPHCPASARITTSEFFPRERHLTGAIFMGDNKNYRWQNSLLVPRSFHLLSHLICGTVRSHPDSDRLFFSR